MGRLHLTTEDVIAIHDELIRSFGGIRGMLNRGTVDYLTDRAERMTDAFDEAALLLSGIAQGHPFLDGNKRTAFAVGDVVLRMNGLVALVMDQEAFGFMLEAAQGMHDRKAVAAWLRRKVKRSEER